MKLIDLNPHFYHEDATSRGQGMSFNCPTHPDGFCRLAVVFHNPLDDGPRAKKGGGKDGSQYWNRTGEDFKTMTLTPSVDASARGHWHGFITNGEIV